MSQPTATPPCACRAVNLAYGHCIGEFYTCTTRCRQVEHVQAARQAPQPTCWEKTTKGDRHD